MKNIQKYKPRAVFLSWILDILIYVVVINLFVQYVSDFFIESFAISLTVAVVMKALLVIILRLEHKVNHIMVNHSNQTVQKLHGLVALLILFLSKFFIIEVIDFIYGDKVNFHNFVALLLMIITMIVFRKILDKIYNSLPE